jgi:hypothetical protein
MAKDTKAMMCAARMPRLHHRAPNEEFDTHRSAVINWLVDQHEVRDAIFQLFNSTGTIVFDKADGTWRGREVA